MQILRHGLDSEYPANPFTSGECDIEYGWGGLGWRIALIAPFFETHGAGRHSKNQFWPYSRSVPALQTPR